MISGYVNTTCVTVGITGNAGKERTSTYVCIAGITHYVWKL